MSNEQRLLQKIAQLEFEHDQLEAEIQYVDKLLRSVGFTNGLETVKVTALELLEDEEI